MIFCFDLDNVICKTEGSDYSTSTPYNDVIKKINILYEGGNKILREIKFNFLFVLT
jgi:hypothetical protein